MKRENIFPFFWESEVQNSLTIERRIQLPDDYATHSEVPMVRQHLTRMEKSRMSLFL